jgi:hypothetical protein
MVRFLLLIPLVMGAVSPTYGQAEVRLPKQADFHLFLLVGQSNMAGRGTVTAEDNRPDARILMLDKDNRWVPAVDPLHFDKPKVVGVGLGRSFAQQIAKANPAITIGLIPCAVGGSPIAAWEPGGYHKQTKTYPYDDMLPRLQAARKVGTIKAILWHQGESDSNENAAPVYEAKLHALIARIRGACGSEQLPFIAGQMGQFAERPWNQHRLQVDAAHRGLPENVANTAFVSSDGLTHRGDEVHFDSKSYRELGRRYAQAYFELTK